MNELVTSSAPLAVPTPRRDVSIRVATMDDLPFLDGLQKKYGKALGYFPTKQFEGYIEMGAVLVARASSPWSSEEESEDTGRMPVPQPQPLGYCISRDRYLKRDELGVIYQLCVAPGDQRKLIGAALIQAVFERSAYGCRLFCCWCAQDLDANYFWESMGFLPIAFRAGSAKKKRVHIFWQRRINEGDTGEKATPYWYPCQTNAGAMGADRLVFPIPPGVHWRDVQAIQLAPADQPKLDAPEAKPPATKKPRPQVAPRPALVPLGGFQFQAEQPATQCKSKPAKPTQGPGGAKAKASPERSRRIQPQLVSKARELRDRYLEHVNSDPQAVRTVGKYAVSRTLSVVEGSRLPDAGRVHETVALLPAA